MKTNKKKKFSSRRVRLTYDVIDDARPEKMESKINYTMRVGTQFNTAKKQNVKDELMILAT